MQSFSYTKDPDAKRKYLINWIELLDTGDDITASTWTLDPENTDTDLVLSSPTFNASTTSVFAEGGTPGVTYNVTNRVTTEGGSIDDRTVSVFIKQQ